MSIIVYSYMSTTNKACGIKYGTGSLTKVCGCILVATNGKEGKQQMGVDLFYFWITEDGIIPSGAPNDTSFGLSSKCNTKSTGESCTACVIEKIWII